MNLRNRKVLYAAVALAAAGLAVALILVSVLGSSDKKAASTTTTTATTTATTGTTTEETVLPGAEDAAALLRGIPQRLNELGNPKARVTMMEFADLQCPFCKVAAVDALPAVIREYVRPGKLKLVFTGMYFVGADSEKALRAVYAAGLQGKLWNALELLYRNQGPENSGWVTDNLLRAVGDSIPGLDTDKMISNMHSAEVDNALGAASQQAAQAGVDSTPTFFAGPSGGTLEHLNVAALTAEAFRQQLDPLVK